MRTAQLFCRRRAPPYAIKRARALKNSICLGFGFPMSHCISPSAPVLLFDITTCTAAPPFPSMGCEALPYTRSSMVFAASIRWGSVAFSSSTVRTSICTAARAAACSSSCALCAQAASASGAGGAPRLPPFGRVPLRRSRNGRVRPFRLLGLPRKIGRGISLREIPLCGRLLRGPGFAAPHRCFAVVAFCSFRARMLASSFSTRFLLRKNRRSRLPAPLGPLFCRPRHGSAAPGPQRQNPGPPRFQLGFAARKPAGASPPLSNGGALTKSENIILCASSCHPPRSPYPHCTLPHVRFSGIGQKEKAAAENRCGCEHAIYEL